MPSIKFSAAILTAVCLATSAFAAPAGTASAAESTPTTPYASENSNEILWSQTQNMVPQAIRGGLGSTVLGPQNVVIDLQNADLLAPPSTDAGTVYEFYLLCSNRILILTLQRQRQVAIRPEPQSPPDWWLGKTTEQYVSR